MNPFLTEKRRWNSYPTKKFKTFKRTRLFLIKGGGSMINTFLKTVHVYKPLRYYGLTVFISKEHMYCQKSWYFVLFCSVFYCYYDFRKQHFTKDNNEKKSHGRRNETTLYLRLKTC